MRLNLNITEVVFSYTSEEIKGPAVAPRSSREYAVLHLAREDG